jgi:hypothetical protein
LDLQVEVLVQQPAGLAMTECVGDARHRLEDAMGDHLHPDTGNSSQKVYGKVWLWNIINIISVFFSGLFQV